MPITALPPAPNRSMQPEEFITKTDNFLNALPGFVTETNATVSGVNTAAAAATAAAQSIGNSTQDAQNYAATAQNQANVATTKAGEAATSTTNAANSAAQAANRVDKAGDTMTGALSQTGSNPTVNLSRTATSGSNIIYGKTNNTNNWALVIGEGNTNFAGFHRYNQSTGAYVDRPLWLAVDGTVNIQNNLLCNSNVVGNQFYTQAGAVNPGFALVVRGYANTSSDRYVQVVQATEGLGNDGSIQFRHLAGNFVQCNTFVGGQQFTMSSTGQGSSPGGWVSTSDRRVKTDNVPISGALGKVEKITGYKGVRLDQFKVGSMEEHPVKAHLFAQDVYDVLPEAVIVPENYDRNTDTGDLLALDHNGVIALLVEAVKELSAEVKALKAKA